MVKTLQVDDTTTKVLQVLLDKGNLPSRTLAKDLGISHQTVRSKIKKLTKAGIIKGFRAKIDLYKLGFISQEIYVTLGKLNTNLDSAIRLVVARPEVVFFAEVKGKFDFIIRTYAKDVNEIYTKENELRTLLSEVIDIVDWQSYLVIREYKSGMTSALFKKEGEKAYDNKISRWSKGSRKILRTSRNKIGQSTIRLRGQT